MTDQNQNPDRDPIPFDPACPRPRIDGWTEDKQRAFVEALADCGIIRHAAAQVGMSERSVSTLRRRPDGASFARACDAAVRLASPRLNSIAFERGVEGTIKRYYYHGELKAEERVYDNRLLTYLLGRLDRAAKDEPSVAELERGWAEIVDRIDHDPPPGTENDDDIWEEDGQWWTDFPPPQGFDGSEVGKYGDPGYRRHLSRLETEAIERREQAELHGWLEDRYRRRDRFFGFAGGRNFFGHWEAGTSGTSEPSASSGGVGNEPGNRVRKSA